MQAGPSNLTQPVLAKPPNLSRDPPILFETCFPVSNESIGMKKWVGVHCMAWMPAGRGGGGSPLAMMVTAMAAGLQAGMSARTWETRPYEVWGHGTSVADHVGEGRVGLAEQVAWADVKHDGAGGGPIWKTRPYVAARPAHIRGGWAGTAHSGPATKTGNFPSRIIRQKGVYTAGWGSAPGAGIIFGNK